MKKILLAVLITIVSAGLLFSQKSLTPKEFSVVLENSVRHCYTECEVAKNATLCRKVIDGLEAEMREFLKITKRAGKKIDLTDPDIKDATVKMRKYCPKEGKRLEKKFDK